MRESHLRQGCFPVCSRVCVRQNPLERLQKSSDIFLYYQTPMKNPSTLRIQDKDVTSLNWKYSWQVYNGHLLSIPFLSRWPSNASGTRNRGWADMWRGGGGRDRIRTMTYCQLTYLHIYILVRPCDNFLVQGDLYMTVKDRGSTVTCTAFKDTNSWYRWCQQLLELQNCLGSTW